MEIVINSCYGGYGLSQEAFDALGGHTFEADRSNPKLVEVVKTFGSEKASGWAASLEIIEIPDDVEWYIEEYNGMEWVAEVHRTWP